MNTESQGDSLDIELECVHCKNLFIWTASEQEFYKKMKFPSPKRCARCRRTKKEYFNNRDNA